MRFLIDRCAGRRLAESLRASGHDVVEARLLGPDPGDAALLSLAEQEKRIVVTIDADFGELIFLHQAAHRGVIRLPDVAAQVRIRLVNDVLEKYALDLEAGAIITVRGGRIRVSRR